MSRSRPNEHAPNPSTRWFEWNGEKGNLRYYDKTAKETVDVDLPFDFLLLDQLGSIGGWHKPSQSGIYSNAVRDSRQDVLVVKAFKEGTIAEGVYRDIKDRVNTSGGHFVANCYCAYKRNGELVIGCVQFKGAALGAWSEFTKAHRADLYKQAVQIHGFTEGQHGRVVYRMPAFTLKDASEQSRNIATALDAELQAYLDGYLARNKQEQTETPQAAPNLDDDEPPMDDADLPSPDVAPYADDIPF